jgi:hypothetical protein
MPNEKRTDMESIGKSVKKKFAASVTFLFGNRTKYNPIDI